MKQRQSGRKDNSSGKGQSWLWVWVMAILLVGLGFVVALTQLALEPVDELRGDYSEGQNWQAIRDALRDSRIDQLSVTESDLNRWLQSEVEALRKAKDRDSVFFGAHLQSASVKLEGDVWHLGMRFGWENTEWLQKKSLVYIASGRLESSGGETRVDAEKTRIGKAPLGKVPLVGHLLLHYFTKPLLKRDTVKTLSEALSQYPRIELEDGLLNVARED